MYDVGLLYNTQVGDGLKWASVVAASIAHALCPGATVDSAIDVALDMAHSRIKGELTRGLKIAEQFSDAFAMRDEFYKIYSGRGIAYSHSWANEVVTKASSK